VVASEVSEPDELAAIVARVRREAGEAGELPGPSDRLGSDLDEEVRVFLYAIATDGSYAEAAAVITRRDPDLANP